MIIIVWFGVYSLGESCALFIFFDYLILLFFYDCYVLGLAVIALGLYLVSFRSQKLSLFAFCLCTMGFGLWEFHFAASLFLSYFF